ncbi:hypothetical protein JB92DRAFT_3139975 [Gautieria morchelliformis]|nr:hypothetical protein JB92DRAFT_3139975 [Gautieria morchelliformis]
MSSWEESFRKGVIAFRTSEYEKALKSFDEAIENGGRRYNVYDSRAAVLEKLGKFRQALRDSRKAIELAPEMRHGYARSARLFLQLEKYDVALDMIRLALERVHNHHPARRLELETLQSTISNARDEDILRKAPKTPYFSKLPVELISEVFLYATEMASTFPVVAGMVCSHWRTVSLSMPSLWQSVTLSHMNPVKKFALWWERSRHRITDLRVRHTISMLQLRDALKVCGPSFFSSLKSVRCEVDVIHLTSPLLSFPNVQTLDLEHIHLSLKKHQLEILSPIGPLVPLDRMSSARSLILDYVLVDWSIVAPRLSSLRILIIRTGQEGNPTTDHLRALLVANPHLEKLVLETGSAMEVGSFRGDERIVLSNLTHLELLGPMNARVLVAQLSLPLLERFAISQCLSPADQVMDAFEPAPMALAELTMHTCSFSAARLAPFLQTLSRITKLEITHSASLVDSVVDVVSGSQQVDGQTRLNCPLLKHVDFSHCTNLNGGPIVRLVKPRLAETPEATSTSSQTSVPVKIEAIHLDGCVRIDPTVPEWLRARVRTVSCQFHMSNKKARRIRQ